ncbi:MAG: conjugal transfer protein [Sporichthyaceae bacterium]|nr:conjugal transfer protein [Sporichthyaceae bacterium]
MSGERRGGDRVNAASTPDRAGLPGVRLRSSGAVRIRAAHVLLWALVGLAAFSGVRGLAVPPPPSGSGPAVAPPAPAGPAGFAELFVAAYVSAGSGSEASLVPFMGADVPSLSRVEPGVLDVGRTTVVDAREVSRGYWSVTVAAEIRAVTQEGEPTSLGLHFYRVSVATAGGDPAALVAVGVPAVVSLPRSAAPPRTVFGSDRLARSDPAAETVQRFLSAFLAGQGELARYTSPMSGLAAVSPPPFRSVVVDRIVTAGRDAPPPGQLRVLATVTCVDPIGAHQVLAYALDLASRDGRWEVAAMPAAVPLASPEPSTGGATTPPVDAEPDRAPPPTTVASDGTPDR